MTDVHIEAAHKALSEIGRKLQIQRRRREQLEAARRPLAWSMSSGDPEARRELDRVNEQEREAAAEIRDLELALQEGQARLRAAERAALETDAANRLRKARLIEQEFLKHASTFDGHLAAAANAFRQCQDCRKQL